MVVPGSAGRSVRAPIHRLVIASGSDATHRLGRFAWRPRSRFVAPGRPPVPASQRASPASRFTVTAMMNAPNRYDTIECRSTARRISLLVRFVSETWNVVPMVNVM